MYFVSGLLAPRRGTRRRILESTSACAVSRGSSPMSTTSIAAGVERARRDAQPDLLAVEGHRQRRLDGRAGDLAGRGVDARRHVDRDDRGTSSALIASISPAASGARLAREAGAEERVDDDVRRAEVLVVVLRVDDAHLAPACSR